MTRVLLLLLVTAPCAAIPVRGTLLFPRDARPAETQKPLAHWRIENGILPITPLPSEPHSDAVVILVPRQVAAPKELDKELTDDQLPHVSIELKALRAQPAVAVAAVNSIFQFKNSDSVAHSLYLLHGTRVMPPEPTAPGQVRSLKFGAEGAYELRDVDFPHLRSTLLVVTTPYFTHADEKGGFSLDVPEGTSYTLKVFFHGTWMAEQPVETRGKSELSVKLVEAQ